MIYTAQELHNKLINLTLVGQEEDGELQFMGTDQEWDKSDYWNSEDDYIKETGRDDYDSAMENYLDSVRGN